MRTYNVLCSLLLIFVTVSSLAEEDSAPFVKVKRPAIWVPDLDRAILFYRDVLGFTVVSQGELDVKEGSVLLDLFNTDASLQFRRALFSSSTEENALFVMESENAPEYKKGAQRSTALVIQTDDLSAVESRAKELGFMVGNTNFDVSASTGVTFRETTIIGPGGQAALVYELGAE